MCDWVTVELVILRANWETMRIELYAYTDVFFMCVFQNKTRVSQSRAYFSPFTFFWLLLLCTFAPTVRLVNTAFEPPELERMGKVGTFCGCKQSQKIVALHAFKPEKVLQYVLLKICKVKPSRMCAGFLPWRVNRVSPVPVFLHFSLKTVVGRNSQCTKPRETCCLFAFFKFKLIELRFFTNIYIWWTFCVQSSNWRTLNQLW